MTWEKIFLHQGEVRPIWRCLLSLSLVVLGYIFTAFLLGIVLSAAGIAPGRLTVLFWINFLLLPLLLGIFQLLSRVFDRRPLGAVGLAFFPRWTGEFALGLGLGALMLLLVAAMERLLGLARFHASGDSPLHVLAAGLPIVFGLAVAATNEELVFRGYPFQRLVDSIGPVGAVGLSSAVFGVVHLGNPSHTLLSTLNTMLVGVPFSIAYLRTRALWMPVGLHFAWNGAQYVLGLPVSGVLLPAAPLQARVGGAVWLTGAAYGPEGSVLATGVIVVATFFVAFAPHIHVCDAMKAMLLQGAALDGSEPPEGPPAPSPPL